MDRQFEMAYDARQMRRLSAKLMDLLKRLDPVNKPLTRAEKLDARALLQETIAEMRMTAGDLESWQTEPKKKFWQFWK